jgi:hypothetical protein
LIIIFEDGEVMTDKTPCHSIDLNECLQRYKIKPEFKDTDIVK